TTLIAHGFPAGEGVAVGAESDRRVREAGAVPATIGVLDGEIRVGLRPDELERFDVSARKVGPRDLAVCVAPRAARWPPVGGPPASCRAAGIRFMGTGGIGGVHRGYPHPPDVSADLGQLARTEALVVSAGVKSLLDVPATLEVLETLGVPVLGFGTSSLPLFYSAAGGPELGARVETAEEAAQGARDHWELGGGRRGPLGPGGGGGRPGPASADEPRRRRTADPGGTGRGRPAGRTRPGRHAVRARVPPRAQRRTHTGREPGAHRRECRAGGAG